MKIQKFLSSVLAASILFATVSTASIAPTEVSAQTASDSFYGDQLSTEHHYLYNDPDAVARNPQTGVVAKIFYDAVEKMYDQGILRTGTESFVVEDVDQSVIEAYTKGDKTLTYAFAAGVDAFYADHPEIFYVNFDNLSFVVKQNQEGEYILSIGTGRTLSYARPGFETEDAIKAAEDELEAAAAAIIAKAEEDAASAPTPAPTPDPDATPTPIPTLDPQATPQIFEMADMVDTNADSEARRVKTRDELLVRSVHEQLVNTTSYRLESYCSEGNEENIRTPYGPLITHEGLCEGYSRTFKYILDKLGIPCILVNGVYQHNSKAVEVHMWNYVQLNGEWYAVDATFDDPKTSKSINSYGLDGYENKEFLLVGADTMNKRHIPVGILSANEYEFIYPDLSPLDLGEEVVFAENGLKVQYSTDMSVWSYEGGKGAGGYKVSYNGKGFNKAAEEDGKYILVKFHQKSAEEKNAYVVSEWTYADTFLFGGLDDLQDEDGTCTIFPAPHLSAMEFAVTSVPPRGPIRFEPGEITPEEYYYNITYHDDPLTFEAQTGTLYNPQADFNPPPYIKTATPTQTSRIYIEDGVRDVTIVYDQPLDKVKDDEDVGFDIRYQDIEGATADIVTDGMVTDFEWDGDRTVTFKFHPKDSYAYDSVLFFIRPTNLVGKITRVVPNEVVYCISYRCHTCLRGYGIDWNVFGKPQLLENTDVFDPETWEAAYGEYFGPNTRKISHRLTLVATDTTPGADKKLNDILSDEDMHKDGSEVPEVLASDTYNINLSLCSAMVVKTGDKLRVMVGFPKGYGPDNEGVTFKAYHFIADESGVVTGVEEIRCEVTKYGLLLYVDSFSPFAIAAVAGEPEETNEKLVLTSNSMGGKVTANDSEYNGMFKLAEGGSQDITITPDEGYIIDRITIGQGENSVIIPSDEENASEMKITVNDADVQNGDVIDVQFVLAEVREKETQEAEETGVEVVVPQVYTPEIVPLEEPDDVPGEPAIVNAYLDGNGNTVAIVENANVHYTLIAAEYDEKGALKNIKRVNAGNGTITFNGIAADKIFLWNALDGMTPLCGAKEIQKIAPTE